MPNKKLFHRIAATPRLIFFYVARMHIRLASGIFHRDEAPVWHMKLIGESDRMSVTPVEH